MAKRNQYSKTTFSTPLSLNLEATAAPAFNAPTIVCTGDINFERTSVTTDATVITDGTGVSITQNATDRGIINFTNVTLTAGQRFQVTLLNDRIGIVDHIFPQISGPGASGSYANFTGMPGGGSAVMMVSSDTGTPTNQPLTLSYVIFGRHV